MSPTMHGSSLLRPSTITPLSLSLEELWSDDGILILFLLVDVGANPNAKLACRMHIIAAALAVHFILYCMRSSDYYHYGSGDDYDYDTWKRENELFIACHHKGISDWDTDSTFLSLC